MTTRFNTISGQSIQISDVVGLGEALSGGGVDQSQLDFESQERKDADLSLQNQITSNDLNLQTDLTTLETQVTSNTIDIESNEGGLRDINFELINLDADIKSNDLKITALQHKDLELDNKILMKDTDILDINFELINLDTDIKSNDMDITALQLYNIELDNKILMNDTDILDIGSELINLHVGIKSNTLGIETEEVTRKEVDLGLQNQIDTNDTDLKTLQTDLVTEITNRTNGDSNLQGQIDTIKDTDILALQNKDTSLDSDILALQNKDTSLDADILALQNKDTSLDADILTLGPQKLDLVQTFTDTANWDAANKSAAVSISGGSVSRTGATTLDYAHSTQYSISQDIDFEFTVNSLIGPNLIISLLDVNTQGNVSIGTLEAASSEIITLVVSTTGSTLSVRYFQVGDSLSSFVFANQSSLTAGDIINLSIRNGIVRLYLNEVQLNNSTTFFNDLQFKLTQNYYVRVADLSPFFSSFNISLKESLPPLGSIFTDRNTLYEIKYNPESDINIPVPLRIGQKLTLYNNLEEEQYSGLQGSDIEGGDVLKIISDHKGNLYIAGSFTTVNGVTINRLVKYNIPLKAYTACDGGVDDGQVNDMVLAEDDLIILVGTFTAYNGGNTITKGGRILRYDITANTFSEAVGGLDNTGFSVIKDPVLKHVWIGGSFINVNNNVLANRIVQYNYSNDSYVTVPNSTTASIGIPSGNSIRDIRITPDRQTVYISGGFNLNNAFTGNNNSAKYDITTETFSSLGVFNQITQHMELFENKLYIAGEALTQITQNDGTIKVINEIARYDSRTDQWFQVVPDNFLPDKAVGTSEVDDIYALPNGDIILGGFFINKFTHIARTGRRNIGSGFTPSSNNINSIVYDEFSGCLYLGGSTASPLISNDTSVSYNRIVKIPLRTTVNANFDYKTELVLGDKVQLEALDLNSWI